LILRDKALIDQAIAILILTITVIVLCRGFRGCAVDGPNTIDAVSNPRALTLPIAAGDRHDGRAFVDTTITIVIDPIARVVIRRVEGQTKIV